MVANLATALAKMGKNVVAVDGNLTTSNLGLHLGIPLYPTSIQDVMKGRAKMREAIYHHSAGFKVMPADISFGKQGEPAKGELMNIIYALAESADYVLLDSAAGLGREARAAIETADEMITVTNPELPALTDALKLAKIAERAGTRNLGVILNKVRDEKHEIRDRDVEEFLGSPLLGKVHASRDVRISIARKQPVILHRPKSRPSRQIMRIASRLVGHQQRPPGLLERFFDWLG
jgi:septum site-determining protein MinD